MKPLTADRLRQVLRYEPRTGLFFWVEPAPKRVVGGVAGYTTKGAHPYVRIGVDGKHYLGHRLAWLYMTGAWPEAEIDHRNRIKSDNRWHNLREATHKQNAENQPSRLGTRSGVRGVYLQPNGRYQAYISHHGKRIHLGRHDTLTAAKRARRAAERQHFTHL